MAIGRIGLLIEDDFCAKTLKQILEDADFDVDLPKIEISKVQDASVLDPYDLVILNSEVAQRTEEGFFSLILSARGFILVDSAKNIADLSISSMRYIDPYMSPEEIVSRVNSVLFQYKNIRKSPRISVNLPVDYRCGSSWFQSNIQNLSQNGAFIASLNPPEKNELISAHFTLTGDEKPISVIGRVLYSIGYDLDRGIISHPGSSDRKIVAMPGMGIFFEKISDEDREAIRIFVDERAF
ncbi:MAG: PilZ domain-containing protein [Nitrospirae bacterium]|nr:PilZ domain-containing protein [Nitrospirota bacterium]